MFIPNNQYYVNALINGIPDDRLRFFRTKFDNVSVDHVSSEPGVAAISRRQVEELNLRVNEIIQGYNNLMGSSVISKEQRDLSKVIYIYNYMLANVMYTQCEFAGNTSNVFGGQPYKNSAYGALVLHDAVCSGMSDAIDCLCKVMGVESTKLLAVPSDPWGGGHAFNTVKIGYKWYKLDVASEIGLNPGHKIRGGRWKDRNFLTPFSESNVRACVPSVPNCMDTYPRENILRMIKALETRGLKFEYLDLDENRDETSQNSFKILSRRVEGTQRLPKSLWKENNTQ